MGREAPSTTTDQDHPQGRRPKDQRVGAGLGHGRKIEVQLQARGGPLQLGGKLWVETDVVEHHVGHAGRIRTLAAYEVKERDWPQTRSIIEIGAVDGDLGAGFGEAQGVGRRRRCQVDGVEISRGTEFEHDLAIAADLPGLILPGNVGARSDDQLPTAQPTTASNPAHTYVAAKRTASDRRGAISRAARVRSVADR